MAPATRQKERLDCFLERTGAVSSREQARWMILAGAVHVNGRRADKVSLAVAPNDAVLLTRTSPLYVSRGGIKLASALDAFGVQPCGLVAMDVGASTGGFTDCLLQRGAIKIFAVDVGYGQLAWKLRQDPRVEVIERTNIRYLEPHRISHPIDLLTIDVSFISLGKVLVRGPDFLSPTGRIIALVKPQFEVGKGEVDRGGLVKDAEKRRRVVQSIVEHAAEFGLRFKGDHPSPITGRDGNHEVFIHLEIDATSLLRRDAPRLASS